MIAEETIPGLESLFEAHGTTQKAYLENKTLREAVIEFGYVTAEEFDCWVEPSKMVGKKPIH